MTSMASSSRLASSQEMGKREERRATTSLISKLAFAS